MERENCQAVGDVMNAILCQRELVKKTAKKYLGKYYADWVDDITQDVMIKALNNLDKFDVSKGNLNSWIFTITRNMCFDLMAKKANSLNNITLDENFILVYEMEKPFEIKELRRIVKRALDQLSESDRTMMIMRYYMNCSGREIAEFLGIPESQFTNYFYKAKTRLRKILGTRIN